jgi:hypothetical protein
MLSLLALASSLLLIAPILASTQSLNQVIDQSIYADYAQQAWHVYQSSLYDPVNRWLRLQYDSSAPSNYWNAAVAYQSIMHYGAFNESMNGSDGESINQLIYQLIHTQRTLGESDYHLRNNYNDDCAWMIHGLTALYDRTNKQHQSNNHLVNQGNVSLIDDALILHDWIRESEDSTCCGNDKGGIWWVSSIDQLIYHTFNCQSINQSISQTTCKQCHNQSIK